MATIDYAHLAMLGVPLLFCTLTTPPEYWEREEDVYIALRKFRDWLQRSEGIEGAIVRKEYGKRGMLHYHLVIFGLPYLSAAKIRDKWTSALGYKDGQVRIDIQAIKSAQDVARYIGKYCAKVAYHSAEGEEVPVTLSKVHNVAKGGQGYSGRRWWYVWGNIPLAEKVEIVPNSGDGLDLHKVAARARRIYRRVLESREIKKALSGHSTASKFNEVRGNLRLYRRKNPKRYSWMYGSGGYLLFDREEFLERLLIAAITAEDLACSVKT